MVLGGLLLGVIAIFLPPLAVLVRAGCGFHFLLNIILCFFGWIPAILHAWFVIADKPSARQRHAARRTSRDSAPRSFESHDGRRSGSRSRSRSRSVASRPSTARRSYEPIYRDPAPPMSYARPSSAYDPYHAPAPRRY